MYNTSTSEHGGYYDSYLRLVKGNIWQAVFLIGSWVAVFPKL
jgi:hypothetical protein